MAVAIVAFLVNALYLQVGAHPAPMRGASLVPLPSGETTGSLIAMPRPRPAELVSAAAEPGTTANDVVTQSRPRAQVLSDIQRELARRGFYDGPLDGIYGPKMDAAIRDFEQGAGLRGGEPNESLLRTIVRSSLKADRLKAPPASPRTDPAAATRSSSSPRVMAVQQALSDFGYGQLKLSGILDEATKVAVEKFERERKLPLTGQVSDRLMRELVAVTGRPLE